MGKKEKKEEREGRRWWSPVVVSDGGGGKRKRISYAVCARDPLGWKLYTEDEDYDPETDKVESWDDHIDNLYAEEEVVGRNNPNNRKDTDDWTVAIVDNSVTKSMNLSVKAAIVLPPSRQIILEFNTELQLIDQTTRLLNGFLGSLGANFQYFSINEESWKIMDSALKEHAYDTVKKKCRQNALNRSKQLYTHTGGSKTLARRKDEEEAIANIKSQDGSLKEISHSDSLARVLGKEHSGQVQPLGFGPCRTKIIRNTTQQSNSGAQIQEYQKEITKDSGSKTKGRGSRREGKEIDDGESIKIHNLTARRHFAT
ncbi:hypothetical protein Ahy_B03g066706 [Arachis hypogaea]|uniref:Uncharacterized protein n=1 Tax=Arachis hypogaea TaxID=3818 RepID=A0A445A4P5_ARAHY|nr:hypothetical protein Ahy_B03g066706 [Arachis hypogaea]